VSIIEFDNRMEDLVSAAKAVVTMGGYNTYCEILSFDKPALIVPRILPREEQLIRTRRAVELGLVEMLLPSEAADAGRMAAALRSLPNRPRPSQSRPGLRLEGMTNISLKIGRWLEKQSHQQLGLVERTSFNP
jgi:predicted glycosyltransferase